MIQGSQEWFAARLGRVTSSRVSAVITKGRNGGIPLTRNTYMDDLISERIRGIPTPVIVNAAMERGAEMESRARTGYSLVKDVDVEQVGFIDHPTIPMSGASLDGIVGADGFVELKCPNTDTHLETVRKKEIPKKYTTQILWQAACRPERRWADFVSYDPRAEPRIFIKRMEIDRAEVSKLEDAVRQFLNELAILEERVRAFVRRAA